MRAPGARRGRRARRAPPVRDRRAGKAGGPPRQERAAGPAKTVPAPGSAPPRAEGTERRAGAFSTGSGPPPRQARGTSASVPPMYGLSGAGTRTLPSRARLFSSSAMSMRGGAATVLLSVWGR